MKFLSLHCDYIKFKPLKKALKEGYGKTLKDVILSPYQYSCFNNGTKSSKFLKNPLKHDAKEFFISLIIAEGILHGKYKDPTNGATHYYNPSLVNKPTWVNSLTKVNGLNDNYYHLFFK